MNAEEQARRDFEAAQQHEREERMRAERAAREMEMRVLKRAEDELEGAEEGSEERRVAERDKRRYEAFLKLAEG